MTQPKEIKKPVISIIIPVYNVENYIHQCVNSILAQTFQDFEALLIDDGSLDGCPLICDSYAQKDSRIRVIHKHNNGVSSARNTGLSEANGEYIAFCDSDDYLEKDYLANLYRVMKKDDPDLVSAGYKIIDETGALMKKQGRNSEQFVLGTEDARREFIIQKVLAYKIGWEICSKLYKAEIIRTNSIRFCETCENFAEDLGFLLNYLLYSNKVSVDSAVDYCYLRRHDSMMGRNRETVKLNALNEVSKDFGKRFLSLKNHRIKQLAVIHYLIMNTQYDKIVMTDRYPQLPEEIQKIQDVKWYKRCTFAVFIARKEFFARFGKAMGQKILLLSTYCLHHNWRLHTYLSAVFYRFIYVDTRRR